MKNVEDVILYEIFQPKEYKFSPDKVYKNLNCKQRNVYGISMKGMW